MYQHHKGLKHNLYHKENLYRWLYHITTELNLLELLAASDIYPDEVNNLEELLQLTKDGTYSDYDAEKFAHIRKPNNQITLSTRHSSKGLEFEVVIMLGMEHTISPSYRSLNNDNPSELEEETRLFFVYVSRSKRVCYFLRSKKLTKDTKYGTRTDAYTPSMFWKIIKDIQSNKTTRTLPNC
ncbi:3'-5' exonuclease [Bacillus thuringiensis]|uniref:3'-5' exonuclease n=1 Tax=Bacillus thuringiensis TaxID=1428 RepID=UPI003D364AD9